MGSSQDPNPFVKGGNVNPHVNPNANSKPSTIPQESGTTVEITIDSIEDLKARQKILEAKEADLKKREEELKKREEEVAKFIEEKNWPPFYPLIHHDIAKEIPIHLQKIQYVAFGSWLGLMVCLAWNFIAITAAWFQGQDAEIWLLAVIFIITGVPGSYFLWYRPLYRAMRTDSALKFSLFFLTYICHITFCVFATIAPPMFIEGKSLAGIMPAIDYLTWNATLGGLYFIGFGLFALETLISIWVIQEVYWYFRGSGKAAQVKRQATTMTMMQAL